jgi:hypothetical protein
MIKFDYNTNNLHEALELESELMDTIVDKSYIRIKTRFVAQFRH